MPQQATQLPRQHSPDGSSKGAAGTKRSPSNSSTLESAQSCTPTPAALPYHNAERVLKVLPWKVMDTEPFVLLALHKPRA